MLSGVGCVAKGSGDVGIFGVPEDAGRGWFHEGEEKQERKVWPPNAFFVGAGKGKVVPNIVNAEKLTSQRGKSTPFLVLPCSTDKVAKQCSEPCSYLGPALWTVLKLFLLELLTKQYVRRKDTSFTVGTSTLGVPLNFCVF